MIDPKEPRRPLEGVRAVTMTIFQAGPICFAWMADFGAEVIKIEPPGTGERGRQLFQRPDSPVSSFFETHNRGVKGITLNIQTRKGIEILYKLVKDADIFAQNFRPGVAERHGFAYEDLIKVNPRIVYLTTSAYGPDGPTSLEKKRVFASRSLTAAKHAACVFSRACAAVATACSISDSVQGFALTRGIKHRIEYRPVRGIMVVAT